MLLGASPAGGCVDGNVGNASGVGVTVGNKGSGVSVGVADAVAVACGAMVAVGASIGGCSTTASFSIPSPVPSMPSSSLA